MMNTQIEKLAAIGQILSGKYSHVYRPDIDGLRAVAVLAVLLFHCFPTLVSGGFVGVDVFFVISGYLIGRSSFEEIVAGRYSARAYFGRRARRIFPALLVVLSGVLIAGWWILLPIEYELLGKHVAGASVFISNWQFWREVGYFNTEASLKPLLHLWSLAVEEQFYLVLPLFLLYSIHRRKSPLIPLIIFALICFFSAVWRLPDHKAWGYFHLFSRGWELMIGVLLAYAEGRRARVPESAPLFVERWRPAVGGIGLAMVLGSAGGFSSSTLFPGAMALVPTIGAALFIAAGAKGFFNRLLGLRPLAYIGLISYPLYLWHWPILSMLRVIDGNSLDLTTRLGVFLVSFPLAALTYHLVEQPLRVSAAAKRPNFALVLWVTLLAVGAAGYMVYAKQGVPGRFPELDTNLQPASSRQVLPPAGFSSERKAILLGDSNALMYANALSSHYFRVHGQELIHAFRAGCKPFYNLDKHTPGHSPQGCPREVNPAIEQATDDPQIDTILVVAALRTFEYFTYPGVDDQPSPDQEKNKQIISRSIDDTFAKLAASRKKIVVFFTTPTLNFVVSECQKRPVRWRAEARADCFVTEEYYRNMQNWSRHKLNEVAARYPNIQLFDPAPHLCREGRCEARLDGKLIYSDGAHLNALGAERMAEHFNF